MKLLVTLFLILSGSVTLLAQDGAGERIQATDYRLIQFDYEVY